ncbi:trichohyalin-like [Bombus pascuorum]|uniref:trichohyalin-like n=1 Tax=Bombus pascuorum TaxID=65598 RepID=UPI00212211C4|nr:trichohyalin-like [Bombus pascuorum]
MVHMNEVTNLMDRMMKVSIFHPSEKLRMLKDEEKTFLDPNLIMNARHRILREDLSASSVNDSVLAETRKLLMQEETKQLYMKKQKRFLERELKKFEMEISKSRPKFSKPYTCTKRNFISSDDEDFWRTTRKLRNKITVEEKKNQINSNRNESIYIDPICKNSTIMETDDYLLKLENEENQKEGDSEVQHIGSIKVTITDKTNSEIETQRLYLLRKYFDILKQNAIEKQRFRDIKVKIQQNIVLKIMRKYFYIWKACVKDATKYIQKQTEEKEVSEEQKIEMFINTIIKHQEEVIKKNQKPRIRNENLMVKESNNANMKKKSTYSKRIIVEPPAQCRLNAQKQIIEKQKAKLAEQSKIIEELKLKQMQEAILMANRETMDIAKKALTNCGQSTRRTLIQLMQQNGYRDEILTVTRHPPEPPKFLLRMEARAEARRKRVKLAEELRRQKLEEQKRKEEAARMEEERKKRRLQQEALAEARRSRKEQEQNRQREIEKLQRLNSIADEFYRKYLLRHYIVKPFVMLIKELRINTKKAEDYYRTKLTKKIFTIWKKEVEIQYEIKTEIAESSYRTILMSRIFKEWKQQVRELNLKYQVAVDFYDMKLLDKYFNLWRVTTFELIAKSEEKTKLVIKIYENKLKVKYFGIWKRYLVIAIDIEKSEKRKNELRQLVQEVIPDFDPIQRDVALED